MGIRYYAYPITADEYPKALDDPCAFHGSDPLMDAWGPVEEKPEMLYLDKCWTKLQVLLGPSSGIPDRPALQLVDGQVTHVNMGWIPYERALSPAQVKAVAADLATVDESDVRRMAHELHAPSSSDDDEYGYVAHYLSEAKEFTARLASQGCGLVYMIG